MSVTPTTTIEDLDFDYENTIVRIVALTNLQEIMITGTTLGPLEEGKEYETHHWIGSELVRNNYARFHEEHALAFVALNKIHWRETKLQPGLQISALPDHFYPKLRRYLKAVRERASTEPTAANEYMQATRLAKDIINCRLKKIVSLAASPTRPSTLSQILSREERILFDTVRSAVSEWESQILKIEAK